MEQICQTANLYSSTTTFGGNFLLTTSTETCFYPSSSPQYAYAQLSYTTNFLIQILVFAAIVMIGSKFISKK